jgi:hypothetical protein
MGRPARQSLQDRGSGGAERSPSARGPPEGGSEGPEVARREVPTGTDRNRRRAVRWRRWWR